MDPRFRRNHQLHLLLKKRTYVSDHELYEMMRSKQVYKAQNELRRELERRIREIKLDQKVKVASFMVQKATFIKMVAAREKGLRHLLDVKKHVSEHLTNNHEMTIENLRDFVEEAVSTSLLHNEREYRLHLYDGCMDNDAVLASNHTLHPSHDTETPLFIQSVNNEWMEDIAKKRSEKGKTKHKEKNANPSKSNPNSRPKKTMEYNETYSKGTFANDKIVERIVDYKITIDKEHAKQKSGKLKTCPSIKETKKETTVNHDNKRDTHMYSESKNNDRHLELELIQDEKSITLPDIEIGCNCVDNADNDSIVHESKLPPPLSNQRFLQPLPLISNTCKSSSSLDIPRVATLPKHAQPHDRERSVTMLFVEDSDDDEEDFLSHVSTFDIEAFTKHFKRKRGYSVVIASNDIHHDEDKEPSEEIKKKEKRKSKMTTKYPHHPSSWGVKVMEESSPRRRSNQWYQDYVKNKLSKKSHHKVFPTSQDLDVHHPNHHRYKAEGSGAWKTPSSSHSQQSPEVLCQLKLQRLKLHCQLLSRRVALFVSS